MEGKNIKVYGTLINQTQNIDSSMRDSQHNDLIAVAYQLFDERFNPKKGSGTNSAVINIDRYQDIINKRLTALSYDPNGDLTSLYSNLYVSGDTNIGGNLHVNGGVSGISLGDLDDVNTSGQTAGAILKYNGTNWVPGSDSGGASVLNELGDVTISSPATGQTLRYNGSSWVNDKLSLGDLSDLSTAGAQDGDILIYDAAAGKWKPSGISLSSIINRISNLEGLWTDNGTTLTAKSGRSVTGAGFYDSTIS